MQAIYLLPFALFAFAAASLCAVVPRWRRHILAALVAPIAFAVCGIVGMLAAALVAEKFVSPDAGPAGVQLAALLVVVYCIPGAGGAWVAVRIAHATQRLLSRVVRGQ
jgi:hypothetical protein